MSEWIYKHENTMSSSIASYGTVVCRCAAGVLQVCVVLQGLLRYHVTGTSTAMIEIREDCHTSYSVTLLTAKGTSQIFAPSGDRDFA